MMGSPWCVTALWWLPLREEAPAQTGTAGNIHSLLYFFPSAIVVFHQLLYLIDLHGEWVFCPDKGLQ